MCVLDSLFAQPVSKSSLVYLLVWHPPLHTPYVPSRSPSHYLLFAKHAHMNATCFAEVPRLCHLIPVSLKLLLGTVFYLDATHPSDHSHLTCNMHKKLDEVLPCGFLVMRVITGQTDRETSRQTGRQTHSLQFFARQS